MYKQLTTQTIQELQKVILNIDSTEVEQLIQEILTVDKVFFIAVGRVFLSLNCFIKYLGHLGINCQIVGSVTEKPIGPNDLLLIASGSGESKLPVTIAQIAKTKNARIGLITASKDSTLLRLSNFSVYLDCPTKVNLTNNKSAQSMTFLFDQSLHLFGDIVGRLIQEKLNLTEKELWNRHANLE